jgi:uncharacterized protein (DUF885 family)
MRKTLILVLVAAGVLLGTGAMQSQQNGEDAKFTKFVDTFLDAYWKFYPTAGTMNGFAKYNDKLEDLAESNIERYLAGLDKFNAELVNKIAKDKLSPEAQIDLDLVRNLIDFDQYRLEKIAPQLLNPLYYNEILYYSLAGLLANDVNDAKLKAATERLKAIPGFVKQAKENLKTPPKEYTDAAAKQAAALLDYYKTELPKAADKGGAEAKSKFQAEYAKAVAAVDDYAKFLSGELQGKSTGNVRFGPEAHQRTLQIRTGHTMMLNDLNAIAAADTKNIRNEMFKACFAYYKIMDPKFDIENPAEYPANLKNDQNALTNAVVQHVLDKIKSNQPAKTEWAAKIKSAAADIKAFLGKTKILDIPDQELTFDLLPPFERGYALGRLAGPAPYDKSASFTYLLNPYADALAADQQASFMDEFTNYMIPMWTIRNVYPGRFFPAAFTAKDASIPRKLSPNAALQAGWPLYIQDMFIYAGFNNYDLKQRLMELKLKLQAVIDFQVDVSFHEGNKTDKDRAIKLMTETGFQTQAEAERKWNLIVLHPGVASYAYIGYQEILEMEKNFKSAKGDQFNKKDFARKLLNYGSLPFRFLKDKVAQ